MFISLLLLSLAVQPKLPPGWRDVGRSLHIDDADLWNDWSARHLCVSDDGRLVYGKDGSVFDSKTGKRQTLHLYSRETNRGVEGRLSFRSISAGWMEQGIADVFLATGSQLGINADSNGAHPGDSFVGTLEGKPVLFMTGKGGVGHRSLQAAGVEYATSTKHGVLHVQKGTTSYDVSLPSGQRQVFPLYNAVDWQKRRVYVQGDGTGQHAARFLQIFHFGPQRKLEMPKISAEDAAIVGGLPGNATVLADGSICGGLRTNSTKVAHEVLSIYLGKAHDRWRLLDGFIFYGASKNGRFAAYGWWALPNRVLIAEISE